MKNSIILLFGLLVSASAPPPPSRYYVDIRYESPQQVRYFFEQGYDVASVNRRKGLVSLVMAEHELRKLQSVAVVSRREIARSPDPEYKTPDEVEKILLETEQNYPHLASVEEIGRTIENRKIYAINLTAKFVMPGPQGKPAILFDALHHAREVMTPEVALDIVEYLTKNYETDSQVRKWMNDNSIWVIPMVNPDGNNRVWTSDSMWRKNVRGGYGVDVNRNYPYDWGACNGSSSSTGSEIYRGASASSEPETKALMGLVDRIKPILAISYHSYAGIVIYPFGCSPKKVPSPDNVSYEEIGRDLAGALENDSGNGTYDFGTSYELLYNVDGGSIDWMYAQHKTRAYVIEMNSDSLGFQPSYKEWRDKTVQKQRKGWQLILDRATYLAD